MGFENDLPVKILVADDDPQVLRFVSSILKSEGYSVITAKDGKAAYEILQSEKSLTAAIFDIFMPHIEGLDLVRYMRSERRFMNIPVIIMTGETSSQLSSGSFSAGAVAFLPKPFRDTQLISMLSLLTQGVARVDNEEKAGRSDPE